MTCAVEGCGRAVETRGYCGRHYSKLRIYGSPTAGRTYAAPGSGKIFIQEAISSSCDECLLWPYAKNSAGYGHLSVNGRNVLAHRIVCEAANGLPPHPKAEATHSCGNGHLGCINPRHLAWKSRQGNADDMVAHGRSQRGERMHMAKLTEDGVRHIWANPDLLPHELAAQLGVSRHVVRAVRRKVSWSWLTDALDAAQPAADLVGVPAGERRAAA